MDLIIFFKILYTSHFQNFKLLILNLLIKTANDQVFLVQKILLIWTFQTFYTLTV